MHFWRFYRSSLENRFFSSWLCLVLFTTSDLWQFITQCKFDHLKDFINKISFANYDVCMIFYSTKHFNNAIVFTLIELIFWHFPINCRIWQMLSVNFLLVYDISCSNTPFSSLYLKIDSLADISSKVSHWQMSSYVLFLFLAAVDFTDRRLLHFAGLYCIFWQMCHFDRSGKNLCRAELTSLFTQKKVLPTATLTKNLMNGQRPKRLPESLNIQCDIFKFLPLSCVHHLFFYRNIETNKPVPENFRH